MQHVFSVQRCSKQFSLGFMFILTFLCLLELKERICVLTDKYLRLLPGYLHSCIFRGNTL